MTELESALDYIDPAALNYSDWVLVGMALKAEGLDCSVWDEWSRRDAKRWKAGDCASKWRSFSASAGTGQVSAGTIFHMALENGWRSDRSGMVMDWGDTLESDGEQDRGPVIPESGTGQLRLYLETLFQPSDLVGFVSSDVFRTPDGVLKPGRGTVMRAEDMIASLEKRPTDIGWTIGDYQPEVGCWIRFNPLDGQGMKNENVTAFRFSLVECDDLPPEEQEARYRQLQLPIAAMVFSGKKSVHAIVRVDAENAEEYRERVTMLYHYLADHGVPVDTQNKNPSRLSRMPGVWRGEQLQRLLAVNVGKRSWAEWMDWISGEDDSSVIEDFDAVRLDPPPLPEVLIEGILRRGHKMLISGSSKAGKSFLLMELSVALATGGEWLGFRCRKGRVLYVNLEIDRASAFDRLVRICDAMGVGDLCHNLHVLNLRGQAKPLDKLVPQLVRKMQAVRYDAVIIDPIYKVITGDENNASDMGAFCNQFDLLALETGCSVIYCHHHSKGAQGAKRAMDRASGSGVFARDPDAQLDMIELVLSDDLKNYVRDGNATAWRLESSLREFPNIRPVNFWFEYPIHRVDESGELERAYAEGDPLANLELNPKRTSAEERLRRLDTAFDALSVEPPVKVTDMADYLGISRKSITRYVEEYADVYRIDNGIITRKT